MKDEYAENKIWLEYVIKQIQEVRKKIINKNSLQACRYNCRTSTFDINNLCIITSKAFVVFLILLFLFLPIFSLATEEIINEEIVTEEVNENTEVIEEQFTQDEASEDIILDTTELVDQLLLLNHINYAQTALILSILIYLFLHSLFERRKV